MNIGTISVGIALLAIAVFVIVGIKRGWIK